MYKCTLLKTKSTNTYQIKFEMNSFQLLKVLMKELETYQEKAKDKNALSLDEFILSLTPNIDLDSLKNNFVKSATLKQEENHQRVENNIERVISQHILFMYRYIKFYSKMVFADSKIKTIEDFSFLITLMQQPVLPKTELIRRNIFEKSSGVEAINRLIKSKLLAQKQNPDDKRSQLVALTDTGRTALFQVFGKMNELGIIACGDLSDAEKNELAILLKKLDRFHFDNYNNVDSDQLADYLPETKKG